MDAYEQDCWLRHDSWCGLIPGYSEASKNTKKHLKAQYKKEKEMSYCGVATIAPSSCFAMFDTCQAQESKPCSPKAAPRKGNENMYVEQNMTVTEKTVEDTRRTHFLAQIDVIWRKKDRELVEKFGMGRSKSPTTPKELVEWIKAGEWSYIKGYDPELDSDEDNGGWCRYDSPIHGIRWTKIKEDKKGYAAAEKLLNEARASFINEIWAEVDPANFIKILEKFEKKTIH